MAAKRPHRDIHQEITNKIITMLENGQGVADCPWYSDGSITRPTNIATGNRYNGINILALWAQSIGSGYSSGTWGGIAKLSCLAPFRPRSATSKSLISRFGASGSPPQNGQILLNLTITSGRTAPCGCGK